MANHTTGHAAEYVALAGEHLSKVDKRIRNFDLEIEALIRDAETLVAEPSVPNHKRIAELVLLLSQLRDNSDRINAFLIRSIRTYVPAMSALPSV